jgi:malate dehydrogenase (oxaloacetate-decarboxylating)
MNKFVKPQAAAAAEGETPADTLCILNNPLLNRGTAFTEEERDRFHLHGLLPDHVESLAEQVERRLEGVRALATDLDRYVYLRNLQDYNETLYFALITSHLEELLPIIYTPTVGLGCQRYSHIWQRPRGLFLSIALKDKLDQILANPRFDDVECIVVTDGERILGLGDQGVGGMGIPVGKLAIYSGCGGIDPATTLPITLDTGTNNVDRLNDPLYFGWRHERVRGEEYDDFIEAFVTAVNKRWPNVLLQWEDFHKNNANRLLDKYRDRLCTFNDDIQGTAAVATGTLLAAINITGVPLTEQRIAVLGGGSAGIGIADLIRVAMQEAGLSEEEARSRFFIVGRYGLVTEKTPNLDTFQLGYRQSSTLFDQWTLTEPGKASLYDVVKNAHPTVLIGVAGQPGMFTEAIIREMAAHVDRPVVFPLSNPTSQVEAQPADIITWTDGRAVIGTGSPFKPIDYKGQTYHFAQTNNSYIFPGVGLGALAVKAKRVTDGMFLASARALAELSPARTVPGARLLPTLDKMREVSFHIAVAVAKQAQAEGLTAPMNDAEIVRRIRDKMWTPAYRPLPTLPLANAAE